MIKTQKIMGSLPLVAAEHAVMACGEDTLAVIRECHTANTTTPVVVGADSQCAILTTISLIVKVPTKHTMP